MHRAVMADGTVHRRADALARRDGRRDRAAPAPGAGRSAVPGGRWVALGDLAHARAGDKGGNCNVGLWVSDPAHWEWLRTTLSSDGLRALMPEAADLTLLRHEFPHLRAVHFVLQGLLGTGGSSSLRVDQIGKSVGEYLRSKRVTVPDGLID